MKPLVLTYVFSWTSGLDRLAHRVNACVSLRDRLLALDLPVEILPHLDGPGLTLRCRVGPDRLAEVMPLLKDLSINEGFWFDCDDPQTILASSALLDWQGTRRAFVPQTR
jgi:hypothetical protein